jgi:GntR family transcriptional regulator, sialic acid-inducible nan operon repressor
MNYNDPIPRRKLSNDVTDRLLARISGGEFIPGSRLPSERQLMETFQVGRPAIREALQNLQRMGLIQITHGESSRVLAPNARTIIDQITGTAQHILSSSPKTLDDLKDARLFFEVGMARLAAARATSDDTRMLQERIDIQAAAGDDTDAFLRADIAFHRGIAGVVGNPIFVAVSEAMLEWLLEYHVGLVRKEGREMKTLVEHRLILERIAAHDVEGAAAAMLAHLTRANDLYDSVNSPRRRASQRV